MAASNPDRGTIPPVSLRAIAWIVKAAGTIKTAQALVVLEGVQASRGVPDRRANRAVGNKVTGTKVLQEGAIQVIRKVTWSKIFNVVIPTAHIEGNPA